LVILKLDVLVSCGGVVSVVSGVGISTTGIAKVPEQAEEFIFVPLT
jgi:hypothetical protein